MKKILIVEDDPIIAHVYKTRLEKEQYQVEIAGDGQAGFYRIHEFLPDVVLLDLMLPKMNGLEILKKIRAQSKFSKIPVLVLTNAYVPNMINDSFLAGATLVFNKATLTARQILDSVRSVVFPSSSSDGSPPKLDPSPGQAFGKRTIAEQSAAAVGIEGPFHSASARAGADRLKTESTAALLVSPADPTAEDSESQLEILNGFVQARPELLAGLRKSMQELSKAQEEGSRSTTLLELYRKVHSLTGSAGIAGLRNISRMAAATEALLKELQEKPQNINASTMRTVAHAIDFLAELCAKGTDGNLLDENSSKLLVVDDEILSRRAIIYAMEKTGLKATSVGDPQAALKLATEYSFDLICLDVQMPGMDGFDLCAKIRALPSNKTTPIIFVTSLTDFHSRAKSTLSGGTDIIAKPFMFIELTVKALTHLLRGQLNARCESQPMRPLRAA